MFGKDDDKKINSGIFAGAHGETGSVFGNMGMLSGAGKNSGTYVKAGNSIFGPNGTTTIFKNGNVTTAMGPEGITTLINNGNSTTAIGPNGTHTILHNGNVDTIIGPDGTSTFFHN